MASIPSSPAPQAQGLPVEKPLLATVYRTMGIVVVACGTLATIWAIGAAFEMQGSIESIVLVISTFASTCLFSLLLFGIAQIITYIGRITVATEQTALRALGQSGGTPLASPPPATTPAAPSPARHTAQDAVQAVAKQMEEVDPRVPCPHCNQKIRVAALKRGPNVCPGCYQEFEVE